MENLHGVIQENVLTALVYDDRGCSIIRNSIPIQAFSSTVYRKIAERAYDFFDQHKKAPKDHIADELEHELEGDNAELFSDVLHSMDRMKDSLNLEYVMSQFDRFNRTHAIRKCVTEAATASDAGDLEAAEEAIRGYHVQCRYTGMKFLSFANAREIIESQGNRDVVPMGIRQYEQNGIGACRKELLVYGAPAKSGKSWFLNHLSRCALQLMGWKVLYVTLEMSAELVIIRMIQNVTASPTKGSGDKDGTLIHFPKLKIHNVSKTDRKFEAEFGVDIKTELRQPIRPGRIGPVLSKLIKLDKRFKNFIAVEQPTGSLTMSGLNGILDSLESTERFIPDLLVVDYADLMYIDQKEYRLGLGAVYRGLRGLAGERNIAVATVSQLNRQSVGMVKRNAANLSEDFSKVMTCDQLLIYSQTLIEKEMGVARLSAEFGRHGSYDREIVISQCYPVGQFLLQAYPASRTYISQYYAELNRRQEERRGVEEPEEGVEDES